MIAALKPYAKMRDFGVPWLGEMPEHWEVRRNGRLFSQRNQTGFAGLPILEVALKAWGRTISPNGAPMTMLVRASEVSLADGSLSEPRA